MYLFRLCNDNGIDIYVYKRCMKYNQSTLNEMFDKYLVTEYSNIEISTR